MVQPRFVAKHACLAMVVSCLAGGTLSCSSEPSPSEEPQPRTEPLALTPPMGFNNWNAFGCDVSEKLIKETADILVASGLKDAGYEFVNIDDCWSLRERGEDGRLVPNPQTFPSGIEGVADYVHGLGLKLGIYGDAGTKTCAGYPGSLGHEELDAQTWADWGVDYVKYDNCYNQSDGSRADYVRRYTAMSEALKKTKRSIVYSICEWGQSQPWEWAKGVGHLWRTTGDISDNWSSVRSNIAANAALARYAGPGHWNDPDMLEIGNGGMSDIEYRTHMSMWAMMAAPLIIGTDLREASPETLAILSNEEIIAIDQDVLGAQGTVASEQAGLMVLSKPLANGDRAVALYNSSDAFALVSVPASRVGLTPADGYRLDDVWTKASVHTRDLISAGVAAHGTVVYRVSSSADPSSLPPLVTVGASVGTLIAGVDEGAVLKTTATNQGIEAAEDVEVVVTAPEGWAVSAEDESSSTALASDASLETRWTIQVPAGTPAGNYAIQVETTYTAAGQESTIESEVVGAVVAPPPEGVTHLSRLLPVTAQNAVGPFELDMSNGAAAQADGQLISLGGKVYTRGLGTYAQSELVYFLGGGCASLTTDVGIDDAVTTTGEASFTIYADEAVAAASGSLSSDDAPVTLSADLTGATWLRLVTAPAEPTSGVQTSWALPLLRCGESSEPTSPELTLFSFETGSESWATANPGSGGSVSQSSSFATEGESGLEVVTPTDGNWFGRALAQPVDLSAYSALKFDLKTGATGTSGEFAIQVGAGNAWCQGGLWAWTNANATRTVRAAISGLECPQGVTLDMTQVRGVWVYLKDGTFQIDNVRAD